MPVMLMALLLCHDVRQDETGAVTLENLFDAVVMPPGRSADRLTPLPTPHFYARVFVDAPGEYRLRVDLVTPDDTVVDSSESRPLYAEDVSQTLAFSKRLYPGLGTAGRYEVRLFANGAYVAHVPFHVRAPEA